jgi:hypothetical protein
VFDEPVVRKWALARTLADRGHLQEAYKLSDALSEDDLVYLASMGVLPARDANSTFSEWMGVADPKEISFELLGGRLGALSWWSQRRDTVAIRKASRAWESLAEKARPTRELELWARYGVAATDAHLALARGDTADATVRFTALPDTVCLCVPDRIITARLLTSAGRAEEAMKLLERVWAESYWDPNVGMLLLERARAADRLGRTSEAKELYRYLAKLWRTADRELQPYVTEALAGSRRTG